MKNVVRLIPLNIGFGESLNSIITFDNTEYETASTGRKILIQDPFKSYFEMNSVTQNCYLEPVFFGVNVGDKITVRLKTRTINGDGGIDIMFLPVTQSGVTGAEMNNRPKTKNMKNENYETLEITTVMNQQMKNNYGIVVNVRAKNLGKIVIKDVEIEIETSKSNFNMKEDLVIYNNKAKFLKMITNSVNADCNNTIYSKIKEVYDNGGITFSDGKIIINSTDLTKFKGVYSVLCESRYYNPSCIYFEYKNNDDKQLVLSFKNYDGDLNLIGATNDVYLTNTTTSKKRIIYHKSPTQNVEYTYFDIGRVGETVNSEISNFIVFKNRYDDCEQFSKTSLIRN